VGEMNVSRLVGFLLRVVKVSWLKETLLAVPRIALLVPKLMGDERVTKRTKLALAGLVVYLASPWDLIPDFIPGLGQLDDAVILLLFVDGVLNQVDDAVLLDNWTGEVATLRRLQTLSRFVARWTPQRLRAYMFGQAVVVGEERTDRKPRDGDRD
jgi:uncharacterized membrane protein YkvA (DUF1232 family)